MQHLAGSKDLEKLVPQGRSGCVHEIVRSAGGCAEFAARDHWASADAVASTEADEVVPALRSEGRCVDQALRPGGAGKFQAS